MGFGAARLAAKPSMLVGFVGPAAQAGPAREAGADFLLIEVAGALDAAVVKQLREAANDLPLGVLPKTVAADKTTELREAGLDFLGFDAETTPAAAILDDDMGYVLALPEQTDEVKRDLFLRSLEPLTLEAVFLASAPSTLTVAQQLELARVAQLTHKPMVCRVQPDASSVDLQCLRAAGVVALIADSAAAVTMLKASVAALPARKQRKDDRPVVSLPRGQAPAEEDDDDDDD
ncbi:MAG: hypothetical protein GEU75_00215 [Dehalococcoidia bacterium]|nr:hypothetical protein [Dehalococcoidia bacterium]